MTANGSEEGGASLGGAPVLWLSSLPDGEECGTSAFFSAVSGDTPGLFPGGGCEVFYIISARRSAAVFAAAGSDRSFVSIPEASIIFLRYSVSELLPHSLP